MRNSRIQHLLDERERLELKVQDQEHHTSTTPTSTHASPTTPVPSPHAFHGEAAATGARGSSFAHQQHSPIVASPSSGNYAMPSSSRCVGANVAALPREASSYRSCPGSPEASSSTAPMAGSLAPESAFLLSPTEVHANLAMVTDGSRYTPGQVVDHSQLPPYSPGTQGTMAGHGDESNEIRLSEYVKGETRAQDMKDSGGF